MAERGFSYWLLIPTTVDTKLAVLLSLQFVKLEWHFSIIYLWTEILLRTLETLGQISVRRQAILRDFW